MGRAAPEADIILVNGAVLTLAASPSTPQHVQGVAIRGGCVLAVGGDREMHTLAGPQTVVVDLEGRTVIPGLIDSHVHMVRAGLTWNEELRWELIGSLPEGLRLVAQAAGQRPPGTWIP